MPPVVHSRAAWGALPPRGGYSSWAPGEPSGHTGHWEGAGGHSDHAMCAGEVRSIQLFHQHTSYIDIAYNWVVCIHGDVYEGRPVNVQSAAQRDGNRHRIAICYMAGPGFPFSAAAKSAMAWLAQYGGPDVLIGHRDEPSCSTSCPGDEIEGWIHSGAWRSASTHPGTSPPPAPNPVPSQGFHHPVLREGARGPAVYELQHKLNGVSSAGLQQDGIFGPRTATAVRNFQTFFKLGTDGIVGPKTWGMLDYCAALKHIH